MFIEDIKSISIRLASPDEILQESHGEVLKPETINYRTQRPEKDGLFCEKIFGPTKNYQCYCGKYKGIKYKGIVCDRCGVEITHSSVRRERLGHIKLASPVCHIWFLRGIPSRLSLALDLSMPQLEKIVYFLAYIILSVDEKKRERVLADIDKEYNEKIKKEKGKENELKALRDKVKMEVMQIKRKRVLSEMEFRYLKEKYGEIFEAKTGAEALDELLKEIDVKAEIEKLKNQLKNLEGEERKKISMRLRFFSQLERSGVRPEWMILKVLPVLPPDLRPVVQLEGGRFASSDLNDLYRRVINRNNRLKYLLEIGAPEVIIRNEKRMLQEAVDALIDNGMRKRITVKATTGGKRLLKSLADMLEGKQGRFRQNLLGKRVDYSGRSVIVVGPELKFNEVGLPKKMALEIFKPFVVGKLLQKEIVFNVREALRLIDEETDEVWQALEEVVKDRVVLLNRAPTLHRLNIQAFYINLIESQAIRIHPTVCRAYNADFDGDQMAVFLPLSDEAQREAKERILSCLNILKPATGLPVLTMYQDIILGIYWLTDVLEKAKGEGKYFSSFEEAILAAQLKKIDLRAKIKIFSEKDKILETSVGRILFNQALPEDFPFQNKKIKHKDLEEILREIIQKYDINIVQQTIDKIKNLGFEFSTQAGFSLSLSDLIIPSEKEKLVREAQNEIEKIEKEFQKGFLTRKEKKIKTIEVWLRVKNQIDKLVPATLPERGPVFQIIDAKARGSWLQPAQMCGTKGLVVNPQGEIIDLMIKPSYREGLTCLEYFISTHGARKGVADKALSTSVAGYLSRRLVEAAHSVIVRQEDCQDTEGIEISKEDCLKIGQDLAMKIFGRVVLENIPKICKKGDIITWEMVEKISQNEKIKKIRVRSPFTCKLENGVCQKCYGLDLGRGKLIDIGEAVGIIAAQSIGEPGTQLTLRAFHVGGIVGAGYMVSGLPRLNELFEMRTPEAKAPIALREGKVVEVLEGKILVKEKGKLTEYIFPPIYKPCVKKNDLVKPGTILTEGPLDPKEIYRFFGKKEVFNYLLKEIQKTYLDQGAQIHDKHIEVILKMAFSRVKIIDPGDSIFCVDEIVEKAKFNEENERLKKEGKNPAKAKELLMGLSRIALTTDSFLSASSFQETSRVLISATIEGKEDKLEGLKENIIIGRKIPAGSGFR